MKKFKTGFKTGFPALDFLDTEKTVTETVPGFEGPSCAIKKILKFFEKYHPSY
jgi:hypothetical protein